MFALCPPEHSELGVFGRCMNGISELSIFAPGSMRPLPTRDLKAASAQG